MGKLKEQGKLVTTNTEIFFRRKERAKIAAELLIANRKLAFRMQEKERCAAGLSDANKELLFQNEQKEKRIAELVIANRELRFQNLEKGKRAAELRDANKDLAFHYCQKEMLAIELLAANKELEKAKQHIAGLNAGLEQKVARCTAELLEISRELEAFNRTVSHDLQTPLRSLSGFSSLLMKGYGNKLDDKGKEFLNLIYTSAVRMHQLVHNLLDLSKLGKAVVVKRTVDMYELVHEMINEAKICGGAVNPEIKLYPLAPAFCDKVLIGRVWANLICNAVKYSSKKEAPVVEIGMVKINGEMAYYVKDNGVGFNMDFADKLFEVFQRLHVSSEFEGTGVGLSTAQRIIAKHDGKIWAESKVDEGAVFYFTLPLSGSAPFVSDLIPKII